MTTATQLKQGEPGDGKTTMSQTKPIKLSRYVKPLSALSASLLYLAEEGNDRLTINQAAFFLIAAAADARGRPLTPSEIVEGAGGVLNASLANTYKVLLPPSHKEYRGIALGWLQQEVDEDDQRRKLLRLTPKGVAVMRAALVALGQKPKDEPDGETS
ncbi:helix-turn-helix domain-containing protein [Novosphingobium meiothermophilum]|uniref:hypothetical protein n=1 Tax=Novosphingobium meiothermophilum TaxID=2202251 RepID=UPI0011AB33C6|nr:hypothetical protein [Novosphingobium meiothermophilum]